MILFLVATLYTAYGLFTLIFAVLLSRVVLLPVAWNGEALFLASILLLWLSYLRVVIMLPSLSVKPERWNMHGGTVQLSNYPLHCQEKMTSPTIDAISSPAANASTNDYWIEPTQLQGYEQCHNRPPTIPYANNPDSTSPYGPANECPNPLFPSTRASQSVGTTGHPIGTPVAQQIQPATNGNLSNAQLRGGCGLVLHPTTPSALVNRLPPLTSSISQNNAVVNKELPLIPPPLQPSTSTAPSSSVLDPQLSREVMQLVNATEGILNVQLMDDQIDYLSRLVRANVPAMDVARLMERMRGGGEERGWESTAVSGEINSSQIDPGTAPPSYDIIYELRGYENIASHYLPLNIWPSIMASGPAYKADLSSGLYGLKYISTYLSPPSMYSYYPVKQEL